jgi:hypothetical protein
LIQQLPVLKSENQEHFLIVSQMPEKSCSPPTGIIHWIVEIVCCLAFRDKWIKEGRPLTKEKPKPARATYPVPAKRHDEDIRAFLRKPHGDGATQPTRAARNNCGATL